MVQAKKQQNPNQLTTLSLAGTMRHDGFVTLLYMYASQHICTTASAVGILCCTGRRRGANGCKRRGCIYMATIYDAQLHACMRLSPVDLVTGSLCAAVLILTACYQRTCTLLRDRHLRLGYTSMAWKHCLAGATHMPLRRHQR